MNDKINITKQDGTTISADLVCFLENVLNGKRYVYYTLNEIVGAGASSTVKIYVSKVQQNNPAIDTPITEDEWGYLKGYMGDALKDTTSQDIKYLPISELSNPILSINERVIAMPTTYDYINKHRGLYATSIANAGETPRVTSGEVTEATTIDNQAEPTIENAPVEENVFDQPAPVEPVTENVVTPSDSEVASEPAPVEPMVTEPVEPASVSVQNTETTPIEPTPVEPVQNVFDSTPTEAPVIPPIEETPETSEDESNGVVLEPINIDEIVAKYEDMIKSIEELKNKEVEAAKRYNATIELSSMHNEQHANYVQNEQSKDASVLENPTMEVPVVSEPVVEEPVSGLAEPVSVDVLNPGTAPIEPTPVTPEPVSNDAIETNWFDMPASN